jgi:CubicO group peptidase (beta-lactamase class C family)
MNLASFKIKLTVLLTLILALAASAFAQEDKDPRTEKVDKIFATWDRPGSPGCALAIINDGRIVYKRGYGMANLEHNIPISSTTIFDTGSVSKQFTAMSILLLAEQGKLSLDDDIRKYLPEIPQYETPVTIRHLIHHTSGLRDYLTLMALRGERDDDFYVDEEVVDLIARQKQLNFKPGDQWLYSNSGYFLLSQIVKRASGKTLRQFADENIFKPLGMKNTHFNDDHTEIVKGRATGYAPRPGGGFSISVSTLDMVGDGNVVTSVVDLFLWDQNFYHNKLGKGGQDLIDQAQAAGVLNSGKKHDYAAGLVVTEYKGLKEVGHGGAFVGYRAGVLRFPVQRFSVACECNLATIDPMTLAHRVADVYLADHLKQDATKAAGASSDDAKFVQLSEQELKDKTGAYREPVTGMILKLSVEEGRLKANMSDRIINFAPTSATEFQSLNGQVKRVLKFEKQGENKPAIIRMMPEGQPPTTFEAVELVSPAVAQLREYVGDYYSEELGVVYKVALEDGKLFVRHENKYKDLPRRALEPTVRDTFTVQGIHLNFKRDDQKRVNALTVDAGRVRNIRFVKKAG